MKITLNIENVDDCYYIHLIEDLKHYSPVVITRENDEIVVKAEGDMIKCSCIVAICDKYRYGVKKWQ